MASKLDATKVALYIGAGLTAVILALSLSLLLFDDPERRPGVSGSALIGGPFELVDQDGRTVDESVLAGKMNLVYFGFTYCPEICPTELANLVAARRLLEGEGVPTRIVFITIDPERDDPAALKEYLGFFDSGVVGLGGTLEQVRAAAQAYRVVFRKVEDEDFAGDYTMDHSTFVYAMDERGEFVTHFGPNTAPAKIAERLTQDGDAGS